MSLETAQKVIVPQKENYVQHFLKQQDINSYFQDQSSYSAAGKYVDQSWEYINRSQTNECGN